ncbi:hypothetical protein [Maridesulfovibrio hydrothermalis]|uniref:DUF4136 domain-containing protein n=1 Tax=Maridesulfovibrio hydrothermalis AM13 = DSM 14728 TaxID=1121451 RepID=L0R8E6_9BACT|nr:hypothetical protein [Maridesulfovibrio hydrothermalis]CCO22445.1 conserved exported protein of unknown function [Maridesulfovibrio hydrothermalis AM13 = DSM 14728]
MLKNTGLIKLLALSFLILTGGCSAHEVKPTVPMTVFNPSPGTFNVKVVLFQLKGNGNPQQIESGIVPIEQNIIMALKGLGYDYAPDGDVNYLIEARIGSISPKLAAQAQSQHIGFAFESFSGWPGFNDYPVIVNEWTPEIQRIKSGPDSCFITMQILIKEVKQQRDSVIYHGTPRPMEVSYALGCPFAQCGQGAGQALTKYLVQLFSRSAQN